MCPRSQFVEIGGHLIDLSVVVVLDFLDEGGILGQHEVNRGTLLAESTSSTDSVDVVLLLEGELVVDNQADLLDIDTSGEEVSGDQDTDGALTELLHDDVSLELVHLTVHHRHREVLLGHDLLKLLNSLLGVAVNECLVNVQV